jgi:hypothetical protein
MRGVIKGVFELTMILLVVVTPAVSGGIVKFIGEGEQYVKNDDKEMLTEYVDKDLASGVAIDVDLAILTKSEMGTDAPHGTFDHQSTLNAAGDVYYARSLAWVLQDSSEYAEREVTAESYVIMPKKFDAEIAITMHFSDEDESQAEIKTTLIYDGVPYEFVTNTNIEGEKDLSLFLYPYCPQFDGLDLDYEDSYGDSIVADDFNYGGSFVMRALKTEG